MWRSCSRKGVGGGSHPESDDLPLVASARTAFFWALWRLQASNAVERGTDDDIIDMIAYVVQRYRHGAKDYGRFLVRMCPLESFSPAREEIEIHGWARSHRRAEK